MEPTRAQVVADIIAEAHEKHEGRTADVKVAIVEALHELEGSGHAWVSDLIDSYAMTGAAQAYATWRRARTVEGQTKRGKPVTVPSFGGAVEVREDGSAEWVQLELDEMSPAQLRQRFNRLSRQRDTMSAELSYIGRLVAACDEDPSLASGRDARLKLEAAA